jgi:hypothetical protein
VVADLRGARRELGRRARRGHAHLRVRVRDARRERQGRPGPARRGVARRVPRVGAVRAAHPPRRRRRRPGRRRRLHRLPRRAAARADPRVDAGRRPEAGAAHLRAEPRRDRGAAARAGAGPRRAARRRPGLHRLGGLRRGVVGHRPRHQRPQVQPEDDLPGGHGQAPRARRRRVRGRAGRREPDVADVAAGGPRRRPHRHGDLPGGGERRRVPARGDLRRGGDGSARRGRRGPVRHRHRCVSPGGVRPAHRGRGQRGQRGEPGSADVVRAAGDGLPRGRADLEDARSGVRAGAPDPGAGVRDRGPVPLRGVRVAGVGAGGAVDADGGAGPPAARVGVAGRSDRGSGAAAVAADDRRGVRWRGRGDVAAGSGRGHDAACRADRGDRRLGRLHRGDRHLRHADRRVDPGHD